MAVATPEFDVSIILFSGMGADATIFSEQKQDFPDLIVPEWIVPRDEEDLSSYCARWSEQSSPGIPCILGGASFGGIVALEMSRHLDALGCLLIGSVRGPQQLPRRIRMLRGLAGSLRFVPMTLLQRLAAASGAVAQNVDARHLAGVAHQFAASNGTLIRWSARQLLHWRSTYPELEVRHIHGDRDRIFPISCVQPDDIVRGGGHVISMTHPQQVNQFIRKHVNDILEYR